MQIFVLGMHRSGTSALTRVLNLAGAHLGPAATLKGASRENPRGFWENDAFVDVNKMLLRAIGCDWNCLAGFDADAVKAAVSDARLANRARDLLVRLDAERPWAMKDPRSCLTFPFWHELTELPVVVLSHRDPIQIADSLTQRNAIPEAAGLALWELYVTTAISATAGVPRTVVDFARLVDDPVTVCTELVDWLVSVGVRHLTTPPESELSAFLSTDLVRHAPDPERSERLLNPTQRAIEDALRTGDLDAVGGAEHQLTASSRSLIELLDASIRAKHSAAVERKHNAELAADRDETKVEIDRLRDELARQVQAGEQLGASNSQLQQTVEALEGERERFAMIGRTIDARIEAAMERLVSMNTEALGTHYRDAEARERRRQEAEAAQIQGLQSRLASMIVERDQTLARCAELERELAAAREAAAELGTELERVESSLETTRVDRDEIAARLADQSRRFRETMDAYQKRKAMHREARARVRAIETSRSWKLAHGLAKLSAFIRGGTPYTPAEPRSPSPGGVVVHEAERPASTSGSAKSEVTDEGPSPVDVVICVHDAMDDVRRCLESVAAHTPELQQLIIVDDGSGAETSELLRRTAETDASVVLHRNETAHGYTRAANTGLKASTAEFVILLNSDTVVTPGWSSALTRCARSGDRVGLVGPLSNAASYQSIPRRFDGSGDWAVNELPPEVTIEQMAAIVGQATERCFPRLPFLNGFCLLFTREVLDRVGLLDDDAFPMGYGEENDYCLRAANQEFDLAVADDAYVFHAKSRSFSHARRKELAVEGRRALDAKHGGRAVLDRIELMRDDPCLERARSRVTAALSQVSIPLDPLSVLYVLPVKGGGGGVHSIVQECVGLNAIGCTARVAVPAKALSSFTSRYPSVASECFVPFHSEADLIEDAGQFDCAVATIFTSIPLVEKMVDANPRVRAGYYIQDYEPWICAGDRELEAQVVGSYTAIPAILAFAKTEWICRMVADNHGIPVHKVHPSIDASVYSPVGPAISAAGGAETVVVSAMIRPKTPRRGAPATMRSLADATRRLGAGVEIHIFGCDEDDPGFVDLERSFTYYNHGILTREGVAEVLRGSDVFVDFSTYQAFGRTALEAMACGCAVAVPAQGGAGEYARDEANSLVVDTSDQEAMNAAVVRLARDVELRTRLAEEGLRSASRYSIARAVLSVHRVLRNGLAS
jgi:GT2 family glycosyltransferase/glycosyltransferase involved in cell wall biosynthesis